MERRNLEAELEQAHFPGFAWAVRCCRGDRAEAEDVLHLAYLKVRDGRARFAGRSAFRTWLFGVIRRTALEQGRRRWTEALKLGAWWREQDQERDSPPAEQVVEGDLAGRLERALRRLSPRQAEVLHLVFYQDLTIQEAADVVGLPVGTARTHYERGKARLRTILSAMGITR